MAPAGHLIAPRGASVAVRTVSKRFGERVTALVDVTFDVAPGEFVLISGPSGAGKSTLLNVLAGFDRPDGGTVAVGGQPLASLTDTARFRREVIGFVFQMHHLIPGLSAEENVEIPLIPRERRRAARLTRARDALVDVGLADRGAHRPGQLSGGERQRVALARALVGRPQLLLADEPTAALDSAAGEQVLGLLGALCRREGVTVVLVSHDPGAPDLADRTLHLRDGRLVS